MNRVKICIIAAGLLICTSAAFAEKIERFTDGQGTVHIGTPSDVAKPGKTTKPEAKPEDITKPETPQPVHREILPKAQRVSRRPMGQAQDGPPQWPPRRRPSPYVGAAPQPEPGTGAPDAVEGQKSPTP